jgi:hypothetical protein
MAQVSIHADKSLAVSFGEAAYDRGAKAPFAYPGDKPNRVPVISEFPHGFIGSIAAIVIDNNYFIGPPSVGDCAADSHHQGSQVLNFMVRGHDDADAVLFRVTQSFTRQVRVHGQISYFVFGRDAVIAGKFRSTG